jgi:hypothetical protein
MEGNPISFSLAFSPALQGLLWLLPIIPKAHRRLYQPWKEGKMEEALELQGCEPGDWGISGMKVIVVKEFFTTHSTDPPICIKYGKPNVRGPLKAVAMKTLKNMYYKMLEGLIASEKKLEQLG